MICQSCKAARHGSCPEVTRQHQLPPGAVEAAGSSWCDCRHHDRSSQYGPACVMRDGRCTVPWHTHEGGG